MHTLTFFFWMLFGWQKFCLFQCKLKAEILLLKVKMTFTLLTSDQCICLKEMITQWCFRLQTLPAPTSPPPLLRLCRAIIMDNYSNNFYNLSLIYSRVHSKLLPNKDMIYIFLNHLHLNSLLTDPEIFVSDNEEDIVEISRTTGIMVDPVYNVKAIRGMLHEMNTNPGRFKGHRILYIHTGEYNFSTSSFDKYLLPSLWQRAHIP